LPRGHGFVLAFTSATVIKPNDDKGTEQFEANGRNNEQVHGSDVRRLIAQKCLPASEHLFAGRAPPLEKNWSYRAKLNPANSDN
jgi:hypothetical protein